MLGDLSIESASIKTKTSDFINLPDNFDARTKWPSCIHPVRDQAQWGSCWAFALSGVLSDLFWI